MPNFVEFQGEASYSEIDQPNPIRWEILYRDNDTYHVQTGRMRCRDYFNDVVAKMNNFDRLVGVYGFDVRKVKVNQEGVYLRVTNTKNFFLENLLGPVREALLKDGFPPVEVVCSLSNTAQVLFLPKELWNSTYTISVVTGMIRCSNYNKLLPAFEEWPNTDVWSADIFRNVARDPLKSHFWKLRSRPPKEGYWYYYNEQHNSSKLNGVCMHTIHNTGFITTLLGLGN